MSKESLGAKKTLEICVSSAVLEYNTGKKGVEIIMKKAGLKIGRLQSDSYHKLICISPY